MASKKIRDLVVKVGSYTDRNTGQEKANWEPVGAIMQNEDDKSLFVMLKRTFNPAGVPGQDDRRSILISAFVPEDKGQQSSGQQRDNGSSSGGYEQPRNGSTAGSYDQPSNGAPAGGGRSDYESEIPFAPCWQV